MYKRNRDNIVINVNPTPSDRRESLQNASQTSQLPRTRSPTRSCPPSPVAEEEKNDLMISYSHNDKKFMEHLMGALEENGLTVWVDRTGLGTGDNFLSKIGQAIINAEVFLTIISPAQIASKYCRDELSLAYISDKPIIPVALFQQTEVFPQMNTGMKLQLASFEWHLFNKCLNEEKDVITAEFNTVFPALLQTIRSAIGDSRGPEEVQDTIEMPSHRTRRGHMPRLRSQRSFNLMQVDFWAENFGEANECNWNQFIDRFDSFYRDELAELYVSGDLAWLFRMLQKEMCVDSDGRLSRVEYENFIHESADFAGGARGHSVSFFDRVNEYAMESFAVREVFRIESTVRVDAIENLGKFRSNMVIEALLDLLNDPDPNIRAVSLVSLARTGHNSDRTIRRICATLDDPDRLVRESACLALGRLKSKSEMVAKLVLERWRNDVISSVRESAELALQQLDSEPARLAIHMTEILQKEIKQLKD